MSAWDKSWDAVGVPGYFLAMATGSIERLPSGSFRAVVRAGKDPITGKLIKLTETFGTEDEARSARDRMLVLVEAENHPARSATVAVLMKG